MTNMESTPERADNGSGGHSSSYTHSGNGIVASPDGKYVIHDNDIMGRGAWSVVKKCTPVPGYMPPGSRAGMKFVVKIIEKDYLISLTKGDVDRAMAEVKREIDVLKHIPPHENVVTFIEYIETEKRFLLIFEEVRCGDLCELILQTQDGKLTEEKSKLYTYQVIKAVLHCHLHDVIHRDIKPENLLVDDDDNIKLTDFGLAKRSKGVCTGEESADPLDIAALLVPYPGCERLAGKRIVCSDVIGTPRYGAPEMFYAKFTQTHYDGFSADTWSIGVVTYITVSGSFPYSAGSSASEREVFRSIMDTPLPHPAGVSALAIDFIQSLLNKDPTKRLPLHHALNHPWLAEVVVPRGSVVAAQLRLSSAALRPDAAEACARFDEEVRRLHICIAKLQHEAARLREERDRALDGGSGGRSGGGGSTARTPQRRAQTPNGTSRIGGGGGSSSAARVASPGRFGLRPRTASRDNSSAGGGSVPRRTSSSIAGGRTRSPLSRSAGGLAVRRGTPARTSGTTPMRGGTPSRPTGGRSASAPRIAGGGNISATGPPQSIRATTPTRAGTPGRSGGGGGPRSHTPGPLGGSGSGRSMTQRNGSSSSVNPANELHLGDQVSYKGCRAIVRFNGGTTFGAGIWIGLEMLEGSEGTNDGSSFIDKKQYFTCPKGKGVFVRASQVRKI